MLTKEDLKWTTKCLSLYSKLGIIPVTFKPATLGEGAGEMRSGKISTFKIIRFKLIQILFTCHALFMSFRTLDYATGGIFGNKDGEEEEAKVLDWDLVPMMLLFTDGYITIDVTTHFMLDSARQLNVKVYNEILKFRGKYKIKLFFKVSEIREFLNSAGFYQTI